MPICAPCRVPHEPEDCEDTAASRRGLVRRCYCQHKPYSAAVPRKAEPTEAVGAGEGTMGQQGQGNTTRSSTFARTAVDQGNRGRRG